MVAIVFHHNTLERLEIAEIKHNFREHKLKVNEKLLTRLLRTAVIDGKCSDHCNNLSLYEFCIFSKTASKDFENLMNEIKTNMLSAMKNKAIKKERDINTIMPKRRKVYIQYLPSSFNHLMNHFKDEESRNNLRGGFVKTLKDVMNIGNSRKDLCTMLEKNKEKMNQLLASHFPQEEPAKQELMFKVKSLKRLSVAEEKLERIRMKGNNKINNLTERAKKWAKTEAYRVTNKGNKFNVKSYNILYPNLEFTSRASNPSLTTRKSLIDTLVSENLVLRNKRTMIPLNKNSKLKLDIPQAPLQGSLYSKT